MLQLVPLASPLNRPEAVSALTRKLLNRIREVGIPVEIDAGEPEADSGAPRMLLILTGGTEGLAVSQLSRFRGPVVLLAHPTHNSFPAALEILAKVRQMNRRGKIVFLGEGPGGHADLQRILGLMNARQALDGTRLGRIGVPSEWLVASLPDERAIEELWGVRIVDVPSDELLARVRQASPDDSAALVKEWKGSARGCVEPDDADLAAAGRVCTALREIARDHSLGACTVRCFDLVTDLSTTGCMALSQLIDDGHMAGCEGDVPATVTMMWMHALTGAVPFMANPQQVVAERNAVWLAHCTIARRLVSGYTLRSHFESGLGVAIQGASREKAVTLARLAGPGLTELFVSDGRILEDGKSEDRCRTQYLVELEQPVSYFLEKPLGNHHVLVPGHFASLLSEYRDLYL
jgi:L-fucose isomerase-like protein